MATFVLTYRSPKGYVPGSSPETMAAWQAWFEGMGDQLTDVGKPVIDRTSLGNCGLDTQLGGYSLISADDLESATVLAKGCPHLTHGGGVEVGALGEVPALS